MTTLYRYAFDKRLVAFWGPFGARPAKDSVTLTDDGHLRATFGFLRLETTLDNVDDAHIDALHPARPLSSGSSDDNVEIGIVAKILGHVHSGSTMKYYAKVRADLQRQGLEATPLQVHTFGDAG